MDRPVVAIDANKWPGPSRIVLGRCWRYTLPLSLLLLLSVPTPVFAHSASERFGDFYGGMLHPSTALEHLLPILALGLLAGQQDRKIARWMLLALPLGLIVGCLIAAWNPSFSNVTYFNRATFILVGLLVTCGWRIPMPLLIPIGLLCGISHGYENCLDLTSDTALHLFFPGVALAGLLLTAFVAAATISFREGWQRIAIRVAGSWITAIGLLVVGLE